MGEIRDRERIELIWVAPNIIAVFLVFVFCWAILLSLNIEEKLFKQIFPAAHFYRQVNIYLSTLESKKYR